MRKFLIGLAVLPFLAGVASAAQPLSDAQLEKITAGDSGLSVASILASLSAFSALNLSGGVSSASNSVSSSPDAGAASSSLGLGEAGLTGAARLGEFLGVVQLLSHQ
jgi:hypothetical protein